MLAANALANSRLLGGVWIVAAVTSGLLAIWNLPLLIWWPLGLLGLGLLTASSGGVRPALIFVGGTAVTIFAVWVASGSNAGTDYFALVMAGWTAALTIASTAARAIVIRRRATYTE
jgi:hypothetical protein